MPNHLIGETSPYLLQHAANPVDWYPWGQEALEKARREDRPIFLSIGYAACHWCHVMAHESFENEQTAQLMNRFFVNIKVDREERPDLDSIYMDAVVALTGQGGWPMSLFLTPDGQPFYGGTYFPPVPRYGMPGFPDVLQRIAHFWSEERGQLNRVGEQLTAHLRDKANLVRQPGGHFQRSDLEAAVSTLIEQYDWQFGGWGHAPRFPSPMSIEFMLRQATRGNPEALKAATHALEAMQRGGMMDVVGGGFHRYSTDDHWLVPHFEKMLYDNAQLALVYLHAFQLTGNASFRRTCESTLNFILRELTDPQGGFYSSLDADSEGEEGNFYLWSHNEIEVILEDVIDREFFARVYNLPPGGNFEGNLILQRKAGEEVLARDLGLSIDQFHRRLDQCHVHLLAAREQRIHPAVDDKVLASWNGLVLIALAEAARALDRDDYLKAAQRNAHFLQEQMFHEGILHRSWRAGPSRQPGYLEDYASLGLALIALYQADFNGLWLDWAGHLAAQLTRQFRDPEGGFFDTPAGQANLLLRPREIQDNATPSGNSLAALFLLALSEYNGESSWRDQVEGMIARLKDGFIQAPTGFSFWLQAADFLLGPVQQVVLVWEKDQPQPIEFIGYLHKQYHPRAILAASSLPGVHPLPALLDDRPAILGQPTVYICQGFVCLQPVITLDEMIDRLNFPGIPTGSS